MGSPAPSTSDTVTTTPKSNLTKLQDLKARINKAEATNGETASFLNELIDIVQDQLFPPSQINQEKNASESTPSASA